ncbi:MAG: M23 family metallopeptidase [Acidobacteriia bacterium]|nr:M23 family metallopeptidase [Terriglobia bacterium]
MRTIRVLLRQALTPVTIMVIPHQDLRALNLKVPTIGLLVSILLSTIGGAYVFSLAVNSLKYEARHHSAAEKLSYYSEQFYRWESTLAAMKKTEGEFRQLFSLNSKDKVLQNADTSFTGSLDLPNLVEELKKTTESVDEIKDYLRIQKDIYLATPRGFPVPGNLTSNYGSRVDPLSGEIHFHSGLDISASPGIPIRATADGVVGHSGWSQNSGFVVVLEHGCGYSTIYAHNKRNAVKVGQRIKTGDVVGYVGSTGKSTGPHVHYEVWKNGKNVNPQEYLGRRI